MHYFWASGSLKVNSRGKLGIASRPVRSASCKLDTGYGAIACFSAPEPASPAVKLT